MQAAKFANLMTKNPAGLRDFLISVSSHIRVQNFRYCHLIEMEKCQKRI